MTQAVLRKKIHLEYVEKRWIHELPSESWKDEDERRAELIEELQKDFGVNDEAVPIILHLIDQLHALRDVVLELKKGPA